MRKELGASKVESVEHDFTACLETDTRDHLIGRRDMLVGLWAGEQLGLPGESRASTHWKSWRPGFWKRGPKTSSTRSRVISSSEALISPEGRFSFRSARNIV